MRTQPHRGTRPSYCIKVLVNLDEHETPQDALAAWPEDIRRLRGVERDPEAVGAVRPVPYLRGSPWDDVELRCLDQHKCLWRNSHYRAIPRSQANEQLLSCTPRPLPGATKHKMYGR
jgi:hypothetical protein